MSSLPCLFNSFQFLFVLRFFIGENIRLDPVMLDKNTTIDQLLQFYMGKNTQDRQNFIIDNLKVELDLLEEVG